jgi:hypothetical protein
MSAGSARFSVRIDSRPLFRQPTAFPSAETGCDFPCNSIPDPLSAARVFSVLFYVPPSERSLTRPRHFAFKCAQFYARSIYGHA